ncbi:MAG TPA: hypothetical protein VHB79_31685 [Polyangiaceae bacterium]|nr:hypothetical protein [Polyangiaceae bacterium]
MVNASVGTIVISLTLGLADWGAARVAPPAPAEPTSKTCHAAAQAPADADSDLEVFVCEKPIQR